MSGPEPKTCERRSRASRRGRGFSLVELLMVVVVTMMVMVVCRAVFAILAMFKFMLPFQRTNKQRCQFETTGETSLGRQIV